jgi:hypothetical protein
MSSRKWPFWLIPLLVAWSVDFLFWKKDPGISILIWVAAIVLGALLLAWQANVKPAWRSTLLILFILSMAFMTALRVEEMTRFVNTSLALLGILVLAATLRTGYWTEYRLPDYVISFFNLLAALVTRGADLLRGPTPAEGEAKPVSGWRMFWKQAFPILRGLFLALPVVLVLGGLLASADLIFADRMKNLFEFLNLEHLVEYTFRLCYILVLAYFFAGAYLHGVLPVKLEAQPDPQKGRVKPFLGLTETGIVLGLVNLLFGFFVLIQFQYLFGGQANISVESYTFSEYAVRGFGELVAVAILSLMLYLVLFTITRQHTHAQRAWFTGLSLLLMGLVLVMLTSAFQRLLLYENAYGFTRMRTYPHVFMVWLGILLVVTMLLEVLRKRERFLLALLLTAFGYAISLGVVNVDGLIARQNVTRTMQGEEFDASYIQVLGDDAVPDLVDLYRRQGLPEKVRDGLGADLACRTATAVEEKPGPWQSYHPSHARAVSLLILNRLEWSQYGVYITEGGERMVEVNGVVQSCNITPSID